MADYVAIVKALRDELRYIVEQADESTAERQRADALDALLLDARRYRLLKANYLRHGEYSVARYDDIPSGVKRYLDLSLDEVLDAAMEAK